MKAQRLKIVESGMTTFSDYYCGVKFTNGLSDEAVAPSIANQIGSFIRIEGVDDAAQVGEAKMYQDSKDNRAPVVVPGNEKEPETVGPAEVVQVQADAVRYTKESLEAIADAEGIAGLRAVAEKFQVKGRGIVELITEILNAQG